MQKGLVIRTLGNRQVELNETAVSKPITRKAEALLIYLACNPRPHPRETLATLLWDNASQARAANNLSIALSSLRKLLPDYLESNRQTIGLINHDQIWVDAVAFERLITAVRAQPNETLTRNQAVQLAQAVNLYHGAFLEGLHLRHAEGFGEWAFIERERREQLLLEALTQLATHHLERRQFSEGITYAQRLIGLDRLNEASWRLLMQLLAADGQPSAAVAQYQSCVAIVDEELGVAPEPETIDLYEQIKSGSFQLSSLRASATIAPPYQHNLPLQTTSFVGREDELVRIKARLDQPDCRLLTLLGSGGVGKTRLAIEAAQTQVDHFLHGVWFVPLAPLETADSLLSALADILNITFTEAIPPRRQLLNYLRQKEMLLVFDNFEHLMDGVDLVQEILQTASEIKCLVTSRERLNLQAEWLLPLAGLPCPPDPETADFAESSSVKLFAQRAQQVQSDFQLGVVERPAIQQICGLVVGMPLGLELAAASVRYQPCAEIAEAIAHNLDTLASRSRDLPARHRSLRAVYDHSWQLLTAEEKRVLPILTVFRGPFSRRVAAKTAKTTPFVLEGLVDKSFLLVQPQTHHHELHPLLKQYAAEALPQTAVPAIQKRIAEALETIHAANLADHTNDLAHYWYHSLWQSPQARTLADVEEGQVETAVSYLFKAGSEALETYAAQEALTQYGRIQRLHEISPEVSVDVAALHEGFAQAQQLLGKLNEAIEQFQQAFSSLEKQTKSNAILCQLADFACQIGRLHTRKGESDTAWTWIQRGQQLLQDVSYAERREAAAALNIQLATILFWRGSYERASKVCQEGLNLTQSESVLASGYNTLGVILHSTGLFTEAIAAYNKSLSLWQQLENDYQIARINNNIAGLYFHLDNWLDAKAFFERSLLFWQQLGDPDQISLLSMNVGSILLCQGAWREAETYFQQALQLSERVDNQRQFAKVCNNLGLLCIEQGDWQRADDFLARGRRLIQRLGLRDSLPWNYHGMAEVAIGQQKLDEAIIAAEKAIGEAKEQNKRLEAALGYRSFGRARFAQGEHERGWEALETSATILREIGNRYELARTRSVMSRWAAEVGRADERKDFAAEAKSIFEQLGAIKDLERLEWFKEREK